MERRGLAQELRRWAVEEMGLPAQKAPPEDVLQRLFIGQCSDIWKYIIRHIHSQRTVRNIEGNLRWYQQLQHSEAQRSVEEEEQQRRKQLWREIGELRSELQHLQEQIRSAETEIISQDLNSEKSQDHRRRSLLLRAFHKKREGECDSLRQSNARIHYRCEQLQEVSRAAQREVIFPPLDSGAAGALPEPEVMSEVRDVCRVRFQFLRSLHDDAISGSVQGGGEELRSLAHQQWMSMAERAWSSHPPGHIVSSLERLALEATRDLRHLQSSIAMDPSESSSSLSETTGDIQDSRDGLVTSKRARSSYERGGPDTAGDLPSFSSLIQEGWAESVQVTVQLRAAQRQTQELSEQLAAKIQEVHGAMADGGELCQLSRVVFDAELRCVMLRGCRDAVLQECRALQEAAAERKQEVKILQQQQQNIQDSCLLLEKKQKQIQILIKGNAMAKTQVRRSCGEVRRYIKEKLLLRPQEVIQESQRLQDSIMKDIKQFSAISLPSLQKLSPDGITDIPAQDLSINRLSSSHHPYYSVYKGIYASIGLPLYKAPETVLSQVADIKKQLLFLRSQLNSRRQAVTKIQKQLREGQSPTTDTLLMLLSAHYGQQTDNLLPKLQSLMDQCEKSLEYGKEVQATVTDWWEQPAQTCLPGEVRGGLTLQQWRDRWTVAVTALQRATGDRR